MWTPSPPLPDQDFMGTEGSFICLIVCHHRDEQKNLPTRLGSIRSTKLSRLFLNWHCADVLCTSAGDAVIVVFI
jgi:hypothetical protein